MKKLFQSGSIILERFLIIFDRYDNEWGFSNKMCKEKDTGACGRFAAGSGAFRYAV